ncbi:MAG: molybdopterin-dependent oxidoreductase [Mycobacterium sp.]|nr:molybdopterin-dependent oxidoreductase [Mycobacterium sp.]
MRTVRSFCRVCQSVCGILVDVEDDPAGQQVLRVRGDRDHPVSAGYTCPKGRALPQLHHHPDRLEHPRLRVDGTLRDVGWEACLDDLAARLKAVIDSDGPQAVGIFFGSGIGMDAAGYRMAEALQTAIATPARFSPLTIDGTAKPLVADLMGGFMGLSCRADYDGVDFLVYVGSNPVVSHGHALAMPNATGTVREIARRGQVWVIDPRHTETARLATGHLAPRPGTDYAVLAYLVRELLVAGADRDILEHRAVDAERLAAAVGPFTCAHTAALADVDPVTLIRLRDAVRGTGRLAVETGTGVTMARSANVTQWLAWALMILTDSMNRPGGAWFHPGYAYQLESFPALPISPPEGTFGPGPRSRPGAGSFLGEWPCAALADEIDAGNIRALVNLGGGLLTAFPNAATLRSALDGLDVLATLEILPTEITALSTHVLPAKDQLERADVTLWDILSTNVSAQYTPAVVAPAGARRSAWWVLAELGRRLGHDLCDNDIGGDIGGDIGRNIDPDADDVMLARVMGRARGEFAGLAGAGYQEAPRELPAAWVEAHLDRLGGWRLAPQALVDQLAALSSPEPLVLVPRRQKRHLNSQLTFLGDRAEVLLNPDDAAAADISDGQPVTVRNRLGAVTGIARLTTEIRPGAVSVPHGYPAANVNLLTDDADIDPLTGMTRYSGLPVSIAPAQ